MITTIVGLFPSREMSNDISLNLENSGFKNEDYIVYRDFKIKENVSFWKNIFHAKPEIEAVDASKLIMSIQIHNEEEKETALNIFRLSEVEKVYEFQNMSIEEAKSLDFIKKIVEIRAKSAVYTMPSVSSAKLVKLNQGILTN